MIATGNIFQLAKLIIILIRVQSGPGNYILHALFGPVLFLLIFNSLSIACSYFGMFDGHGEFGTQCLRFIKSR
jgi:hypothetical protein